MLDRQLWVAGTQNKQRNNQTKKKMEGGGGVRKKCARFCLQPLLHQFPTTKKETREKKNRISKQYSKLEEGKLRGVTKCLQVDI